MNRHYYKKRPYKTPTKVSKPKRIRIHSPGQSRFSLFISDSTETHSSTVKSLLTSELHTLTLLDLAARDNHFLFGNRKQIKTPSVKTQNRHALRLKRDKENQIEL